MAGIVKDTDRGWKAIMAQIKAVATIKPRVMVGVFGSRAQEAEWNEFGTGHEGTSAPATRRTSFTTGDSHALKASGTRDAPTRIPARPFLRPTFDRNIGKYTRFMVAQARAGLGGTDQTYHQALNRLGLLMTADVQQTITGGVAPPNAPSTIKKKGSSTPLIETGLMRSEVSHKVEGA